MAEIGKIDVPVQIHMTQGSWVFTTARAWEMRALLRRVVDGDRRAIEEAAGLLHRIEADEREVTA